MKYYIISGEASGDLHGSNLIKELKTLDNNCEFRAWGGDLMQKQGAKIVKHYRDLAFMGFAEVVKNLSTIKKNMKFCVADVKKYNPDVLILVDYPGFNLRIAKKLYGSGIKIFYYISPTIWAWHKSRIKTIRKYIDKMFVILPFEKEFYKQLGYNVDYVGSPVKDAVCKYIDSKKDYTLQNFISDNNLSENKKIAILPGSRKQEIEKILPVMLNTIKNFNNLEFIIAAAPSFNKDYFLQNFNIPDNVKILHDKTYDILRFADSALVASGTATLETALFDTPQVVCYKTSGLTYFIAKNLVNIKYISLVNLIMDKSVIKELIQNNLTTETLSTELNNLINNNNYRNNIFADYNELNKKIGEKGSSKRLAELIIKYLKFE